MLPLNDTKAKPRHCIFATLLRYLSNIGTVLPRGRSIALFVTKQTTRSDVMKKSSAVPETKLFVLDTNVLLHDPASIFHFEEHDICLPMVVLEEVDGKKHGMTELARNARQVCRSLDEITRDACDNDDIKNDFALKSDAHKNCTGRLYLQTDFAKQELPLNMELGKADNAILGVVISLKKQYPGRPVILVSKDINMRIKARALGLKVQDYLNDQVLEDTDLLYSGTMELPADFWETHGENMESRKEGSRTIYKIRGPLCAAFFVNQFLTQNDGAESFQVLECDHGEQSATIATVKNFGNKMNAVMKITARNPQQNAALNLLMDPEVDFVTLLGQAGTGKTLIALAAALEQTEYSEIIFTRATVPADGSEEIGFLPGDEQEKMDPWMGALHDNYEVLMGVKKDVSDDDKRGNGKKEDIVRGRAPATNQLDSRIKVKSLGFMRGRTFIKRFIIIDESQNLTAKQMKTLITRAGEGTKVVCMGNLAQIDTPYISDGSSGLTYVVDRFKGWEHFGTVTLEGVERSRLAAKAVEVL